MKKIKVAVQNRPAVKIGGRWFYNAHTAAAEYARISVYNWQRRETTWTATRQYSDSEIPKQWRWERAEALAFKVFEKRLLQLSQSEPNV